MGATNPLIVEAKRYDNTQQQYAYQLANEIQAAYNNEINDPIFTNCWWNV